MKVSPKRKNNSNKTSERVTEKPCPLSSLEMMEKMNIEEFVNDYLQNYRHEVLLSPYNGLIDFANAFKEQMLKDAVEGEVYKFGEVAYVKECNNAELTKYLSQFNNGDRVKIIVIHETDIR